MEVLRGHSKGIYDCKMVNNTLASASVDETLRVWDRRNGTCVRILKGHSDEVTGVQLAGSDLYSVSGDSTVRCWDVGAGCS